MPDLIETSLAGHRALRATVDFPARLPAVETAISRGTGDCLVKCSRGYVPLRRSCPSCAGST